jgi:hypothetical protein
MISLIYLKQLVHHDYVKKGENFNLVDDKTVIKAIADFLSEVKQVLKEQVTGYSSTGISSRERNTYEKAIKFINILLLKKTGNNKQDYYPRICIFRRPDKPGALSNMTLLQAGKHRVEKMHQQLEFTRKYNIDFG